MFRSGKEFAFFIEEGGGGMPEDKLFMKNGVISGIRPIVTAIACTVGAVFIVRLKAYVYYKNQVRELNDLLNAWKKGQSVR